MQRLTVPYAEFYITNVCNLSCAGCNRFNDYHFTGYQKWQDYADIYSRWAQEVTLGTMGILGGEPLLNPTFMAWLVGVNRLWPNRHLKVVTNGFQLGKVAGLYDMLEANRNIEIWVGIHNKQHKQQIFDTVRQFLRAPVVTDHRADNPYQEYVWMTDRNRVRVKIEYNWWFHQGAIRREGMTRTLHASDPEKAHANCHMRTCHHFIRGHLYKCGVVALLPEFDQQHPLSLSQQDQQLMHSYRALSIDDDFATKQQFVSTLEDAIPQCRFCPEQYHGTQIFSQIK